MEAGVAGVAGPGRGLESGLVGGQPPLSEVDGDGEAGPTRRAIVHPVGGELGGELLGGMAVGSGRVPAAAFLAGERVEASGVRSNPSPRANHLGDGFVPGPIPSTGSMVYGESRGCGGGLVLAQ